MILRNDDDEDDIGGGSPPCLMHLVEPGSGRIVSAGHKGQWADVKRWRKAERQRLIALRLAIPAEERRRHTERIVHELDQRLGDVSGRVVTAYWPFRGEPDLLEWADGLWVRGAIFALPVVLRARAPLAFRRWRRGTPVTAGVWNIPVPVEGPDVVPDIVIAPLVGFDRACYRLGHGGGFFDRTLAGLARRPRVVGVGYAKLALRTIYPQVHDIPMDLIITEAGTVARR